MELQGPYAQLGRGTNWSLDGGVCQHSFLRSRANVIAVAARTSSGQDLEDGISLFLVPKGTPGLAVTLLPTMDQTRKLCEVTLTSVALGGDAIMGAPGAGGKP